MKWIAAWAREVLDWIGQLWRRDYGPETVRNVLAQARSALGRGK